MNELIEQRLSALKKSTFAELSELGAYQGEKVTQGGKSLNVAIWKDVISSNEFRIIVQTYRYWFFGIGKMDAAGFLINSEGEISCLTRADLYEFI